MFNAGRQILVAGHPRRTPFPNQLNINVNKQTYINMAEPMFFPTGGCCNNFEMGTLGKIGMGLGLGASILGGILGALDDGGGGGSSVQDTPTTSGLTPEQQKLLEEQQKAIDALKANNEALQKDLDELKQQKKASAHQQQVDDAAQRKAASEAQQAEEDQQSAPKISAQMVEGKATTTPFTVEAAKAPNSNSYSGHTGYNIVAGMYKGHDGKPLTHSEIMDLAREIFKGKALPTGEIQLPNEVTVNGKKYSINPDAKPEDVKKATYSLGQYETTYKCEAQQEADHWVGTIDGQPIEGKYNTEDEAKAAAQAEADKRAAEQQSE